MNTGTTSTVVLNRTDPVSALISALAEARCAPEPAVIARLRAMTKRSQVPTLAQVTRIVDGVLAVEERATICQATGLDDDTVLSVVAQLGTWLRHIRGSIPFELSKAVDSEQQMLWQPAVDPSAPVEVIVPVGFERAGSGRRRDVTRALGALVASRPTDEELARWVARRTPASSEAVEWSLVTMLHTFARLGRIDEVDQINPDSFELSQSLAKAWDLLETSRLAALDALERLVSAAVPDDSDVSTAMVLHEAAVSRFGRMVEARSDRLERERHRLAGTLLDGVVPASVGELSTGQVRRIAEASGLAVETPNRTEETEIRRRLEELGLAADADQLVPAAVRAVNANVEDAFWEAMSLRADGEEDWQAPLRELTGT